MRLRIQIYNKGVDKTNLFKRVAVINFGTWY